MEGGVNAHSYALSKLSVETGRLSAEQRGIALQELERRQLAVKAAEKALDLCRREFIPDLR